MSTKQSDLLQDLKSGLDAVVATKLLLAKGQYPGSEAGVLISVHQFLNSLQSEYQKQITSLEGQDGNQKKSTGGAEARQP